ncbi:acidic leucine-rich nuclear phosphoprotein 32-related protein-like isoform X1 [Hibiscus syriacus]|nr:acidic leucine-rich nuclear phosphoprotein 32-related protein-like isoform X1 [Hibiscus syriacus]
MDEIWERAVETALDGHTDRTATRTLTLDGAVKCVQGRLPPPSLLEKFENLEHLSIANIGVSSLEQFPRLRNLQKLILSDNRIAGGLEFLVEAGLDSLRDLDLSNNRIQYIEDLAPLAQLKLVSLDLYQCPVTRVKDYRSRVFGLIKSLKYLDKMDAEGNERPESDEEEEDEDEEEEEDPGSGEIDGEDRPNRMNNGHSKEEEGIADEDEEDDDDSDADEEETEIGRRVNVQSHEANRFRIEQVGRDDDEDDEDDDDENVSDEEVDDDDDDEEEEEEDVVEGHEIGGSDDEEDGVEDDDEEEVDNDDVDFTEPGSARGLMSTEGEIDGHEHGEDDGDDNGETGEEEEQGVENDEEFDDEEEGEEEQDDYGEGYLVQPVGQAEEHDARGSGMEQMNEEEDAEEEEEVEDDEEVLPSSSQIKRKRSGDAEEDVDDDDDVVEFAKSSKKHG